MEYLILASDLHAPTHRIPKIRSFVLKLKKRLDDCNQENDKIRAVQIAGNMARVKAFNKDGYFQDLQNLLLQDERYRSQTALLSHSLLSEEKMKQAYFNALFYKEPVWWAEEMGSLDERINQEEECFMLMAYSRLKAWLGVASYSVCSRYEKEKNTEKLERSLNIFRQIQPGNSEVMRFEKVLSILLATGNK